MRDWSGLFPFVTAGIVLLALGCQQNQEGGDEGEGAPVDTTASAAPAAPPPASPEAAPAGDNVGATVYATNCATCHGEQGRGDGPAGAGLQPPPANFTDAEWKYGADLASVKRTIENGVPGTAMIAWKGALSDAEIDAVAQHEIAFSQGGGAAD